LTDPDGAGFTGDAAAADVDVIVADGEIKTGKASQGNYCHYR